MRYSKSILLLTLVLFGCSSLDELRNRPADSITIVNGKYDTIAKCVAVEADKISNYVGLATLRINDADYSANLFHLFQSMNASYDIKFIQINPQTVQVEGRGMQTVKGRVASFERLLPLIEKCSLPK